MPQIEFQFTLPVGYVDPSGVTHQQGVMRRAMTFDEVEPLEDPRARANEAWLAILLLSRVVIRLGDLERIDPDVIGHLYATDFAFLQDLYLRINDDRPALIETSCPNCATRFLLNPSL